MQLAISEQLKPRVVMPCRNVTLSLRCTYAKSNHIFDGRKRRAQGCRTDFPSPSVLPFIASSHGWR